MHWRPKHYWKPGTKVHVDVDVNGVNAGNGIYGQMSRKVDFKIGHSVIMKANLSDRPDEGHGQRQAGPHDPDHRRQAGGFETRSGTKLIIEKFAVKRMDAATVGIEPGRPRVLRHPRRAVRPAGHLLR